MKKEFKRCVFTMQRYDGSDAIPESAIDWTRFEKNPMMLLEHECSDPLGLWTDLLKSPPSAVPIFHEKSPASKQAAEYIESGFPYAAYPGGQCERDEAGNITKFTIYEISICFR